MTTTHAPPGPFHGHIYGGGLDGACKFSRVPRLRIAEPVHIPITTLLRHPERIAEQPTVRVWIYDFVPKRRLGPYWDGVWICSGEEIR